MIKDILKGKLLSSEDIKSVRYFADLQSRPLQDFYPEYILKNYMDNEFANKFYQPY
jgi:sialic acid synthase SpsE